MRDPSRIKPFLTSFEALWQRYPDLRFGQLVANIADGDDMWNWEEEDWLRRMDEVKQEWYRNASTRTP